MSITLDQQIDILFQALNRRRGSGTLPKPGCLSEVLQSKIKRLGNRFNDGTCVTISPEESLFFASAAVEMWCRSVHSFLISSALYKVSPIWASVCGYYASHYCVRALAHLLGNFQMKRGIKCVVEFKIESGEHHCYFYTKKAGDREHKYYWRVVKLNPIFANNYFFTHNPEDDNESDLAHRSMANYFDHIDHFCTFNPLNKQELIDRITHLSKVELTTIPLPNRTRFPDVENVQLIAYHRIVIFRNFLNKILGNRYNYWRVHRDPAWCREYINFQVVQAATLKSFYIN
jgi:hypothetical protein